jgi:hypothetical protein
LSDLPPACQGAFEVPDSVEVITIPAGPKRAAARTLVFGQGSKLARIRVARGRHTVRCFLQTTAHSVKLLRPQREFPPHWVVCS